jgi:hypothetical protein
LTYGFICFLVAAISAFSALKTGAWYVPTLEFEDSMVDASDGDKRDARGWGVRLNDLLLLQRVNLLDVGFRGIRNGIVALAVASLLFLWIPRH